jgi:dihydropteridine reductase
MKENVNADANILVNPAESCTQQSEQIEAGLAPYCAEPSGGKLDAILNVAGGWAGGNAASKQFLTNSDLMWRQSVWSSIISASLATKFLAERGVLTLTGAAASLSDTPSMLGYGMAKAAVHHLTKSLGAEAGGLPQGAFVAAILPVTLDTPMNRKWMPKADFGSWTPLGFVAELMEKWISGEARPASGTLVKLVTKDGATELSNH